jgi:hypothetical protein
MAVHTYNPSTWKADQEEYKFKFNVGYVLSSRPCLKKIKSQMPVAHACNPSYSGGRDQEDGGLKPVWEKSS